MPTDLCHFLITTKVILRSMLSLTISYVCNWVLIFNQHIPSKSHIWKQHALAPVQSKHNSCRVYICTTNKNEMHRIAVAHNTALCHHWITATSKRFDTGHYLQSGFVKKKQKLLQHYCVSCLWLFQWSQ